MVIVLTVAGLVTLVAGVAATAIGFPIKEFSFGNTLIIAGAVGTGCGLIVIALAQLLREFRRSTSLSRSATTSARVEFPRSVPPTAAMPPADAPFPVPSRASAAAATTSDVARGASSWIDSPPPTREHRHAKIEENYDGTDMQQPSRVGPSKRNLMFRPPAGSSVTQSDESAQTEAISPTHEPISERESETGSLPQSSRPIEGLWKRRRKQSDMLTEMSPALDFSVGDISGSAGVTVLKSGMVDGLAYTLYSDGSIEAELAEGIVRFESIEALRAHLDRPA